ncbi:Protein of unknown function DUF4239 [Pseudomonas sp. GM41(2012)]|jgi:hypothetical protein|uniref:bestrophin-like domain n=1 Tax=Pseudomonas sp. (strain GM41(2012)) TaxID=1144708 RepID=UPI00027032B1|nr:hypothetical protein [Pseudomonas sp. GM41(2012)]EUB73884.1 Protein of unknown function DUF4239 [Pseudomonas sp. GM41(2012)]
MQWGLDEIILFFIVVAIFCVVLELAFRLGRHHRTHSNDSTRSHLTVLQTALLGLLALLLGFNFAMATSRFEARKTLIQDEVTVIGSTYLRAKLLPSDLRGKMSTMLKDYVSARIEFMRAGTDEKLLEAASESSRMIEDQLWNLAAAAEAQGEATAAMNLVIQSLTDVYNVNEKRRAEQDDHVPATVINLLFVVAIGALGFIAYSYGLGHRRRHGSTAIFAILIAMVFTITLDLDQPRSGFIRVGEESMLRLQEDLNRMSSGNERPRPRKPRQERIAGNADNARSQICQVRSQTIACQSLSAG